MVSSDFNSLTVLRTIHFAVFFIYNKQVGYFRNAHTHL